MTDKLNFLPFPLDLQACSLILSALGIPVEGHIISATDARNSVGVTSKRNVSAFRVNVGALDRALAERSTLSFTAKMELKTAMAAVGLLS